MKKAVYLFYVSIIFAQIDTTIVFDASSYNEWVYFSFEQSSIISIENPDNSLDWDLALKRKHMKTNSGLSGIGNGGAYVDSSQVWIDEWENINSLPNNLVLEVDTILYDFYNPITHMFEEGIKNPALNAWGWFDEDYHLNVTHYLLFVKSANGQNIIKFWPYAYYSENGLGANISIRYETGITIECNGTYGDVNQDDIINVIDIVILVNFIIESSELDDQQFICADINQDGIINVIDIVGLINNIVDGI